SLGYSWRGRVASSAERHEAGRKDVWPCGRRGRHAYAGFKEVVMKLEGKVAVLTGAGSGKGRSAALLVARGGAKVVGSDVDSARIEAVTSEVTATGGTMIGVTGDIAKLEDAESLVKRAIDEFGHLDVLVNNAGIMDHMEGVAKFRDDTFDRV